MPNYTFDCPNGHAFDARCFVTEPKPDHLPCPECKTAGVDVEAPRRLVYANPGVNLPNGAGTYVKGF